MIVLIVLFFISGFMIFWGMIGYPLFIRLLGKFYISKPEVKNYELKPSVTLMIVAHNEEKVIKSKLDNALQLEYPKEKLEILVTSDYSTDHTNAIVKDFIQEHKDRVIRLYEAKKHLGKTNAQNEAQKHVHTDFIVMTDANSMLDKDAISELMSMFSDDDIVYVTGSLRYTNQKNSSSSYAESSYWDSDMIVRDIEGKIQTITAGNGALYAVRNKDYHDFSPIECHDSSMPFYYAMKGKRAINCSTAIAYEKAGETGKDEFKRKVRMNRLILKTYMQSLKALNIFKYRWFSVFYFGHRTCRYLLWINHVLFLITSFLLARYSKIFYPIVFLQILFYMIALFGWISGSKNKIVYASGYYLMTITSQCVALWKAITKQNRSTWEKAESTR